MLIFLALPGASSGQTGLPPIAGPLIREGELALRLQPALGLGIGADEVTAETVLGEAGVTPRNGWIADYPATPDVVGELRISIRDAADGGRLNMNRDQATSQLDYIMAGVNLAVTPYGDGGVYAAQDAYRYPDATALSDYYYAEGPPVYTYYVPPADYYSLYGFVPYPFLYSGFWFPGFFVLRDFHRTIYVKGRPFHCSNHFRDGRYHRVVRIDPVARFSERPFVSPGPRTPPFGGGTGATPAGRGGAGHYRHSSVPANTGFSYHATPVSYPAYSHRAVVNTAYRTQGVPVASFHGAGSTGVGRQASRTGFSGHGGGSPPGRGGAPSGRSGSHR